MLPFTLHGPSPVVTLEALDCGTPVFALDGSLARELARHGDTGEAIHGVFDAERPVRLKSGWFRAFRAMHACL
jgi:hypothetical protein